MDGEHDSDDDSDDDSDGDSADSDDSAELHEKVEVKKDDNDDDGDDGDVTGLVVRLQRIAISDAQTRALAELKTLAARLQQPNNLGVADAARMLLSLHLRLSAAKPGRDSGEPDDAWSTRVASAVEEAGQELNGAKPNIDIALAHIAAAITAARNEDADGTDAQLNELPKVSTDAVKLGEKYYRHHPVSRATYHGNNVAVKKLDCSSDAAKRAARRELLNTARASHPNCARFIGFYKQHAEADYPFYGLVLEELGPRLDIVLDNSIKGRCWLHADIVKCNCPAPVDVGRLPFSLMIRYLHGVASGLAFLHSRNIFHRDLGAHNVRVVRAPTLNCATGLSFVGLFSSRHHRSRFGHRPT